MTVDPEELVELKNHGAMRCSCSRDAAASCRVSRGCNNPSERAGSSPFEDDQAFVERLRALASKKPHKN